MVVNLKGQSIYAQADIEKLDSCCILPYLTPDVSLDFFNGARFLGLATGEFKKRVEKWYGAPLR